MPSELLIYLPYNAKVTADPKVLRERALGDTDLTGKFSLVVKH